MWKYFLPTKVLAGEGVVSKSAEVFRETGTKAFVVTGKSSAKKSGALEEVVNALSNFDIPYTVFDEIEENPSFDTVERGGEALAKSGCDFVVAIGGGSPLDGAKAVSVLGKNPEISCANLYNGASFKAYPIIAIPTTSGTGSEVTQYSVLTDREGDKRGFGMTSIFPAVAFLDSSYTFTMPWPVTVSTALDSLSHSLEGEMVNAGKNPLVKMISLKATQLIKDNLPPLGDKPDDASLRGNLQYAAMLAGMVIAQTGTTAVHAAGYPLSSYKGLKHGMANAVTLNRIFERIAASDSERVKNAIKPFDNLEQLKEFLDSFGVGDVSLDISEREVEAWSVKGAKAPHNRKTPGDFDREFYEKLYRELKRR